MTSRDDLDRAIDDVARQMTAPLDNDASANLRARVMMEIDRPRSTGWWRPAFAVVAVAAAAAIVVGLYPRARVEQARPLQTAERTSPNPSATLRRSPSTSGNPAPSTLPNQTSTLRESRSTLRESRSTLRESRSTLRDEGRSTSTNPFAEAPLVEESIAVDRIALAPVAPPQAIAVEQLPTITPIAMTPIGQGEER